MSEKTDAMHRMLDSEYINGSIRMIIRWIEEHEKTHGLPTKAKNGE